MSKLQVTTGLGDVIDCRECHNMDLDSGVYVDLSQDGKYIGQIEGGLPDKECEDYKKDLEIFINSVEWIIDNNTKKLNYEKL